MITNPKVKFIEYNGKNIMSLEYDKTYGDKKYHCNIPAIYLDTINISGDCKLTFDVGADNSSGYVFIIDTK